MAVRHVGIPIAFATPTGGIRAVPVAVGIDGKHIRDSVGLQEIGNFVPPELICYGVLHPRVLDKHARSEFVWR